MQLAYEQGKVRWFSNTKGWGFLERADGEQVFVHYAAVEDAGFRALKEGQAVVFAVLRGPRGLWAPRVYKSQADFDAAAADGRAHRPVDPDLLLQRGADPA